MLSMSGIRTQFECLRTDSAAPTPTDKAFRVDLVHLTKGGIAKEEVDKNPSIQDLAHLTNSRFISLIFIVYLKARGYYER
jgi:hypothetical protein